VYIPPDEGKHFLVIVRSDLSRWVEGRAISKNDSEHIAKFLYEDVICRHGLFQKLVVDGGPENKAITETLADRYGIRRVVVSSFHPEANGLVERGHAPIVNSLSKMSGGAARWVRNLATVLWADRTTVRRSTGLTPYEVEYADRPILPIELEIPTWAIMNWKAVKTRDDLIATRARVLERRSEDLAETAAFLRRMLEANKGDFDSTKNVRPERLEPGQLVLLRNQKADMDKSRAMKLAFRWLGPYVVKDVVVDRGTYTLAEIGEDGPQLRGTFAGKNLRPFKTRDECLQDVTGEVDTTVEVNNEGGRDDIPLMPVPLPSRARPPAAEQLPRPRVVVNVPPPPADRDQYELLIPRGRGRPRKVLQVQEEVMEEM